MHAHICMHVRMGVRVHVRAFVFAFVCACACECARACACAALSSIFCTIYMVGSLLYIVCEIHFAMMMLCSRPVAPGAFVGPGANSAATASDPSLAVVWNAMNLWRFGRPRESRIGLEVEVRIWFNANCEIENDIRQEYRRTARLVVMMAVQRACARRHRGNISS